MSLTLTANAKRRLGTLLGGLAEKAVALADTVKEAVEGSEIAGAEGIAEQIAGLHGELGQGAAEVFPNVITSEPAGGAPAAPQAPAAPAVSSLTAEQLEAALSEEQKIAVATSVLAGVVAKAKSAAATRKGSPKLSVQQFLNLYNGGFRKFFELVSELEPYTGNDGAAAPDATAPADGASAEALATAASKAAAEAVAKSSKTLATEIATGIATELKGVFAPFADRLAGMEGQLDKISKSRDGAQGSGGDGTVPTTKKPGKNDDIAAEVVAEQNKNGRR